MHLQLAIGEPGVGTHNSIARLACRYQMPFVAVARLSGLGPGGRPCRLAGDRRSRLAGDGVEGRVGR